MRLTGYFNLKAKTKAQLRALYRILFNRLADPKINTSYRRSVLRVLQDIKRYLGPSP